MLRSYTTTDAGHMLWDTPSCAHAYAHARVTMTGKRQRVTAERHRGQLLWRVTRAPGDRSTEVGTCS